VRPEISLPPMDGRLACWHGDATPTAPLKPAMPRTPAPAVSPAREASAAQRQAAADRAVPSPIDGSPRMLAQRRQIQALFGAERGAGAPAQAQGVVQGYFILNKGTPSAQRTDDPDQFLPAAKLPARRDQVWQSLRPALETEWKKLRDNHFKDEMLDEVREKMLDIAFDGAEEKTIGWAARTLESVARMRIESRVPLSERASPDTVGGTLSTTPTLGEKEKHSVATYTRTTPGAEGGEAVVTEEHFGSDAYTKGPSRRTREEGGLATTPAGVKQAWTKKQVKDGIRLWTCEAPLARHLALTVWPKLTDSDAGREWEVKFREIDRLITFRDAEARSRYIDITRKATREKVRSLDRHAFNLEARKALKKALLADKRHPAKQQGVLFYDALLKQAVDAGWQDTESTTFALGPAYEADGDLSMILTHWRPVLFFDWILAEDVLNNAADA
jgi:hypothetical protein